MGGSGGYFKDILAMFWMVSGTSDYNPIKFMDDIVFHQTFGYVDDPDRTRGKPTHYTRLTDRFIFNCPADETISIRCWYQKYHPPFASDGTSHSFAAKDNMLAFQAIVHTALAELKMSMDALEFPQELSNVTQFAKYYTDRLIQRDIDVANEQFEFGWSERTSRASASDDYSWV